MKQGWNHSTNHRKCTQCKRKTGDAVTLTESDIEIRIPVCADCAINFTPDLQKIKPAFSVIKNVIK